MSQQSVASDENNGSVISLVATMVAVMVTVMVTVVALMATILVTLADSLNLARLVSRVVATLASHKLIGRAEIIQSLQMSSLQLKDDLRKRTVNYEEEIVASHNKTIMSTHNHNQ